MGDFEVLGEISGVETVAEGNGIRELPRHVRAYGVGRWRKRKGLGTVKVSAGTVRRVDLHWHEAHGIGRKELKINGIWTDDMSRQQTTYVVCIGNSGYPASLELRKIYRRLADPKAEEDGFVRVVDESGEDYLYPARFFAEVSVPAEADRVLAGAL